MSPVVNWEYGWFAELRIDDGPVPFRRVTYEQQPDWGPVVLGVTLAEPHLTLTPNSSVEFALGIERNGRRFRTHVVDTRRVLRNQATIEPAPSLDSLSVTCASLLQFRATRCLPADTEVPRYEVAELLKWAYRHELGFAKVVTNLPAELLVEPWTASRSTSLHDQVKAKLAPFDVRYFEDTVLNLLYVYDLTRSILALPQPLAVERNRVQTRAVEKQEVNQILARWRKGTSDGAAPTDEQRVTGHVPGYGLLTIPIPVFPGGSEGDFSPQPIDPALFQLLARSVSPRDLDVERLAQGAGYVVTETFYVPLHDDRDHPDRLTGFGPEIGSVEAEFLAPGLPLDGLDFDDLPAELLDLAALQIMSEGTCIRETTTWRMYMPGTYDQLPIAHLSTTKLLTETPGDASVAGAERRGDLWFLTAEQEIGEVKYVQLDDAGLEYRKYRANAVTSGFAVYPERRSLVEVAASRAVDRSGGTYQTMSWKPLRARSERHLHAPATTTIKVTERDLLVGRTKAHRTHEVTGSTDVEIDPTAGVGEEWVTGETFDDPNIGPQPAETVDLSGWGNTGSTAHHLAIDYARAKLARYETPLPSHSVDYPGAPAPIRRGQVTTLTLRDGTPLTPGLVVGFRIEVEGETSGGRAGVDVHIDLDGVIVEQ